MNRRAITWIALGGLAGAVALALGCRDELPTAPAPPSPPAAVPSLQAISCRAEVRSGEIICQPQRAEPGMATPGLSASITIGGQGLYVQLTSSNVAYDGGTQIFSADVTVQNRIGQALGTVDGTALEPNGVRVFFHGGPNVTGGFGAVTVDNADGTGTFTAPNQPYFKYPQLLAPNQVSAAKPWHWQVPATVTSFVFQMLVVAEVQYPNGWVAVSPVGPVLTVGGIQPITGTVRDVAGDQQAEPITWSSSDNAVVIVDQAGVVTAQGNGQAVVTAAASGRASGTVTVRVAPTGIQLGAATLSFSGAPLGGADPAPRTTDVANSGGGSLSGLSLGAIAYGAGASNWLTATLSSAIAPAILSVHPMTGGLPVGVYSATLPVMSSLPGLAPGELTVTLEVIPTPVLSASPTAVDLTGTVGGANPAPRVVDLVASGGAAEGLTTSISYDLPGPTGWLTAALGATAAPTALTLSADATGLGTGVYTATVRVTSASTGTSVFLNVALTLHDPAPAPVIEVSPSAVMVAAQAGGPDPAVQYVTITNGGGGALTGLAAGTPVDGVGQPVTWLGAPQLSPASAPATLALQALTGGLSAGTYTALVPLTSTASGVAPRNVSVEFTVSATPVPAVIALSPTTLAAGTTMADVINTGSPGPFTVTVTNAGGGTLSGLAVGPVSCAAGTPCPWVLSAGLDGMVAPATLTVELDAYYQGPGLHTATIPVTSSLGGVAPRDVTVSLEITDPQIALSETRVDVFGAAGSTAVMATPDPVTVTNAGGGNLTGLSYAFQGSAPWLNASLSSTTAPAALNLTINPAGLSRGRYTADVDVSSPKATNARTVEVRLELQGFSVAGTTSHTIDAGQTIDGYLGVDYTGSEPAVGAVTSMTGQPTGWLNAYMSCQSFSCGSGSYTELQLEGTGMLLGPGSYTAMVEVVGQNPGVPSRTVTVNLTVNPSPDPVIGLSRNSVAVIGPVSGSPPNEPVDVTNLGGGSLTDLEVSVAPGAPWLTATLDQTVAPAQVTLAINRGSLGPGFYYAQVTVYSPVAVNANPSTIDVSFTVPVTPDIQPSLSTVSFGSGVGGGPPASKTVTITATGTGGPPAPLTGLSLGPIAYGSGGADWLTAGLSASAAPATLRLQTYPGSLPGGTYTATVPVTSPVAGNSPRNVTVELVIAPPLILLTPSAVTLTADGRYASVAGTVAVSNSGGAPLTGLRVDQIDYQEAQTGWLTASFSTTTAPATLTLFATQAGLAPNTYHATVTIGSPVAGNTQDVSVEFVVPPAAIGLSTTAVTITAAHNGGAGAATFQIHNAGGADLTGLAYGAPTYQSGNGWLAVSLSSTTALSTVTLTATPGTLGLGAHQATFPITSLVAGNSPQTVTVTFNVVVAYTVDLEPGIVARCASANGCHDLNRLNSKPPYLGVFQGGYAALRYGFDGPNDPYVVVGDTTRGALLNRLRSATAGYRMPTFQQLSTLDPALYALIARWVLEGAYP